MTDRSSELSSVVAESLLHLRTQARLTREQLAERCEAQGWPDLTCGAIGSIETGRRADPDGPRRRLVTVDELAGLTAALGVSWSQMLRGGEVGGEPSQALAGDRLSPLKETLMTQEEVAKFLRIEIGTLRRWGADGPPSIRLGAKFLRYSATQVARWCEEHTLANDGERVAERQG